MPDNSLQPIITSAIATAIVASEKPSPLKLAETLSKVYFSLPSVPRGKINDLILQVNDKIIAPLLASQGIMYDPVVAFNRLKEYAKMSTEADDEKKLKIIHAAFFSEFSTEYYSDAMIATFRSCVSMINYNEGVLLRDLESFRKKAQSDRSLVPPPAYSFSIRRRDSQTIKTNMAAGTFILSIANSPTFIHAQSLHQKNIPLLMTQSFPEEGCVLIRMAAGGMEKFVGFIDKAYTS